MPYAHGEDELGGEHRGEDSQSRYRLEPVLGGIEDITFVHLSRRDIVRHKIVADIVDAYEVAEGRAGSTQ